LQTPPSGAVSAASTNQCAAHYVTPPPTVSIGFFRAICCVYTQFFAQEAEWEMAFALSIRQMQNKNKTLQLNIACYLVLVCLIEIASFL